MQIRITTFAKIRAELQRLATKLATRILTETPPRARVGEATPSIILQCLLAFLRAIPQRPRL